MMVLVTGANGFVGSSILKRLAEDFAPNIRAAVRRTDAVLPSGVAKLVTGDMGRNTDWAAALDGVDVVIHAAARVHVMQEAAPDPLAEFRRVNVEGTLNLARHAAVAGARRFIFVSSVKVNGEETQPARPFTASTIPAPLDAYGVSKLEAENGLRDIASKTGMEIVVVRPPLVYGPGVKANFATMMRWLRRDIPLPLGAIYNQRSLVAIDNLVDLIMTCLEHPAAANHTFLVSDGEDVSTTELLRRMGAAMGHPARLVAVPESWLKLAASAFGKQDFGQRLCGSLQVDISETRQLLGWSPPITLGQGLKKAVEGHLSEAHS
jgi:nucleoside-diphosphate-sugar epimerase